MSQSPLSASRRADLPAVSDDPVRWRILSVLLIAIFMSLIGVSIVNVALPSIQIALDASLSDIQWVLSGYALTFGVVLVSAGRAGDLFGRGGIFLVGVVVFTLSSAAAGLAPSADWLNAARLMQGVGSGLLSPQALGMIQQYFHGEERGRAFGRLGTAVGVSVAIGPVLAGFLIKVAGVDLGWRLTFLINLPIGLLTLAMGLRWFPRPLFRRAAPGGRGGWRSLDPVGALLLGLAVLAVLYPFVEARDSLRTWLLIPVGVLLAAAWVVWERRWARRGHSPMVDLGIFSTPSFANGTVIMTLYFLGMTSIWVLLALYVQKGDGRSAFESGVFGIPASLLSAYAAHWAGKRVVRLGRRVVIGGLILAIVGLILCCAVIALHEAGYLSVWWLVLSLSFVGLAQGSIISPNQTLTLADVPLAYAGSSGAIMQTGQRIGTSIGIAVITAIVFSTLKVSSWAVATITGFCAIILVTLVALAFAFKDQRDRLQAQASEVPPMDSAL